MKFDHKRTEYVGLRMSPKLKKKIEKKAFKLDTSVSDVIHTVLQNYFGY